MTSPWDQDSTLRGHWKTVAPHFATIEASPSATIRPARPATDEMSSEVRELMSSIPGRGGIEPGAALRYEGVLGEGGMGIVKLATQVSVGRKVAVKTLRPEHRGPSAAVALLREAWLMGALEHPNVLPLYDVGFDAQGQPVVVLKRIEGVDWGTLLADDEEVRRRFGAADLLVWHLEILLQVCNALRYAHSRGIIHRDLKPENVMVGAFGEVYLLDWGIAVSLVDDGSGRRPLARDAQEMAGTPCYMAPEMLGGQADSLCERTDVYLLGGLLYEIL